MRYMEVLFHYGGAPIGAFVSNYLLEKPRISGMGQGGGERNFHVFYQVRGREKWDKSQPNFDMKI
jgi:myosin heavy subunit